MFASRTVSTSSRTLDLPPRCVSITHHSYLITHVALISNLCKPTCKSRRIRDQHPTMCLRSWYPRHRTQSILTCSILAGFLVSQFLNTSCITNACIILILPFPDHKKTISCSLSGFTPAIPIASPYTPNPTQYGLSSFPSFTPQGLR